RRVVVNAEDVGAGAGRRLRERVERPGWCAVELEPAAELVVAFQPPVEDVENEPAAAPVERRLVGDVGGRERLADVLGRDDRGVGPERPNAARRGLECGGLGGQERRQDPAGSSVWVPVLGESGETGQSA